MLFMCYVDWWICCNILHTYGSAEFKLSTRMYLQLQHWKPYYGVMIMCKYSIRVSNHNNSAHCSRRLYSWQYLKGINSQQRSSDSIK